MGDSGPLQRATDVSAADNRRNKFNIVPVQVVVYEVLWLRPPGYYCAPAVLQEAELPGVEVESDVAARASSDE